MALGRCDVAPEAARRVRDALPFVSDGIEAGLSAQLRAMRIWLASGEEKELACTLRAGALLRGVFRRWPLAPPRRDVPPITLVIVDELYHLLEAPVDDAHIYPLCTYNAYDEALQLAVQAEDWAMVDWVLGSGQLCEHWLIRVAFRWAVLTLRDPGLARRFQEAARLPLPPGHLAELSELDAELRWGPMRQAWVSAVLRARR